MATFQETWVTAYNEVPIQTSATVQFQNVVYRIKTFLTGQDPANANGSWSVQGSSNASTASASDNWSSSADITNDISTNAHSWIVLRSPSGMLPDSAYVELLIDCNKDETGGNPGTEELQLHMTTSLNPYDISSGTTTAAPGLTNANDTDPELTSLGVTDPQILENDIALHDHRLHLVRNERGDYLIIVSRDGTGVADWWTLCLTSDPPGSYTGDFPVGAITKRADLSADAQLFGDHMFLFGWTSSGLRTISGEGAILPIPDLTSMSDSGLDLINGGLIPQYPLELYHNITNPSYNVGYAGRIPDIRFASNQAGVGPAVALDRNVGADTFRYVKVQGFWLPIPDGVSAPRL